MSKVYLVQEIPTDRETGQPKIDITPALKYEIGRASCRERV